MNRSENEKLNRNDSPETTAEDVTREVYEIIIDDNFDEETSGHKESKVNSKAPKKRAHGRRVSRKLRTALKLQLVVAVILMVSVAVIIPSVAWFSSENEIALSTKIDSPATLEILAGGEQAIINLELSDIDTEDASAEHYEEDGITYYYKDYVFCVKGKSLSAYDLQLAHTTNIAFRYDIFTAVPDDNGDILYVPKDKDMEKSQKYRLAKIRTDNDGQAVLDGDDNAIYDDWDQPLDGRYVNATVTNGRVVVDDTLKSRSYNTTDKLQKYANPAYWLKRGIPVHSIQKQDGGFTHSYVLRISWIMPDSIDDEDREEDLNIVQNNKETDVIYITAKASG